MPGGSIVAVVVGKEPRLFSSCREKFPVGDPTVAYFTVDESGLFEWISDHTKLGGACDKAAALEHTLFAVWPGATRSDVFVIDDPFDFKNRWALSGGMVKRRKRTTGPAKPAPGTRGKPAPRPALKGSDDDDFFFEDEITTFGTVTAPAPYTITVGSVGGFTVTTPTAVTTSSSSGYSISSGDRVEYMEVAPETEEDWEGEPPFKMKTRETDSDDDMFFDVTDDD
jgi:hypothetical protein